MLVVLRVGMGVGVGGDILSPEPFSFLIPFFRLCNTFPFLDSFLLLYFLVSFHLQRSCVSYQLVPRSKGFL